MEILKDALGIFTLAGLIILVILMIIIISLIMIIFIDHLFEYISKYTMIIRKYILNPHQRRFISYTKDHIKKVNKYAKKINETYTDHDRDKLNELFESYSLIEKAKKRPLTDREMYLFNNATFTHIKTNKHHPEYWTTTAISKFNRSNPPKKLHCETMPAYALDEMCADWCAMSETFNNDPFEWLEKNVPSRWIFSKEQIEYINETLHEMWDS